MWVLNNAAAVDKNTHIYGFDLDFPPLLVLPSPSTLTPLPPNFLFSSKVTKDVLLFYRMRYSSPQGYETESHDKSFAYINPSPIPT